MKRVLIVVCLVVLAVIGGHAVLPSKSKALLGTTVERSIGFDHAGPVVLANGVELIARPGSRLVEHGDLVELREGLIEVPGPAHVGLGRFSCRVETGRAVFERKIFTDGRPTVARVVAETGSVTVRWPRGLFGLSKGERCSFLCIPGEERFTITTDEGSLARTVEGGEYRPSEALPSGK